MKIPIDTILPAPDPIRSSWDEEALQALSESIQAQGLIVPIKVRPLENGSYQVIYGHRRLEASKRAGHHEIECVVEGLSDADAYTQTLTENLLRENLPDIDIARGIQSVLEATGKSQNALARELGWKHSKVSVLLSMLQLPMDETTLRQVKYGTVEYIRAAGVEGEDAGAVLQKVVHEGLTLPQSARVATVLARATTAEEKQAALDVPGNESGYEARVKARLQGEREEARKERKAVRDLERNTREVKQLLDAVKETRELIKSIRAAYAFGKFSDEAADFAARRIDMLISELYELRKVLSHG